MDGLKSHAHVIVMGATNRPNSIFGVAVFLLSDFFYFLTGIAFSPTSEEAVNPVEMSVSKSYIPILKVVLFEVEESKPVMCKIDAPPSYIILESTFLLLI